MRKCPYCGDHLQANARECSRCGTELGEGQAIHWPLIRTVTDSKSGAIGVLRGLVPPQSTLSDSAFAPQVIDDTQPYRPRRRPPTISLTILDDGSDDSGESIWIRQERFVIGRNDGDLQIGNDDGVTARHAELERTWAEGRYCWTLRDLGSMNGTFVRVQSTPVKHGDELLVGHRVFRFDTSGGTQLHETSGLAQGDLNKTRGLQNFSPESLQMKLPELVEVRTDGQSIRLALPSQDVCLGRDANRCQVTLLDDPTVSPTHARLHCDAKCVWHIEDSSSRNGVWLRIREVRLTDTTEFQLGQQRFLVAFPG